MDHSSRITTGTLWMDCCLALICHNYFLREEIRGGFLFFVGLVFRWDFPSE